MFPLHPPPLWFYSWWVICLYIYNLNKHLIRECLLNTDSLTQSSVNNSPLVNTFDIFEYWRAFVFLQFILNSMQGKNYCVSMLTLVCKMSLNIFFSFNCTSLNLLHNTRWQVQRNARLKLPPSFFICSHLKVKNYKSFSISYINSLI